MDSEILAGAGSKEERRERERRKGQSGFSWQMESRLSLRNYGHSHYTGLWYYVWPGNLVEPFAGLMRSAERERERERDAYGEFGWKSASGYWSRMEKIIEHLAGAFERFVTPSTIRMRSFCQISIETYTASKTILKQYTRFSSRNSQMLQTGLVCVRDL